MFALLLQYACLLPWEVRSDSSSLTAIFDTCMRRWGCLIFHKGITGKSLSSRTSPGSAQVVRWKFAARSATEIQYSLAAGGIPFITADSFCCTIASGKQQKLPLPGSTNPTA